MKPKAPAMILDFRNLNLNSFEQLPDPLSTFRKMVDPDATLAIDPRSELVSRALAELAPDKAYESSCRDDICTGIWVSRYLYEIEQKNKLDLTKLRNRKTWMPLRTALRKFERAFTTMSFEMFVAIFGDETEEEKSLFAGLKCHQQICNSLKELDQRIDRKMAHFMKREPRDSAKAGAAECAYELIARYGQAQPSTTSGGPFYSLAAILYEAISGIADASLDHHCRIYFATKMEK
jgi:hypothetical protein